MDSQVAFSWVVVVGAAVAAVVGLVILSLVSRAFAKTMRLAASALGFAVIGFLLLTVPKWTEVIIQVSGLRLELKSVETERDNLASKVAAVETERDNLATKVATVEAEKESFRLAVTKAVEVTTQAKTQPYDPAFTSLKLDEATKQLNNALELWR